MTGIQADLINTRITGESRMAKDTGWREYPTKGEIARLAYERYEARGRRNGHDIEDWVLAERELTHHYGGSANGESNQADEIVALSTLRNGSTLRS